MQNGCLSHNKQTYEKTTCDQVRKGGTLPTAPGPEAHQKSKDHPELAGMGTHRSTPAPAPDCLLSGLASLSKSGPAAALLETFGQTARLVGTPGLLSTGGAGTE